MSEQNQQSPLDPATIMAAHTADADGLCKQHDCEFVGALWPCMPYRLTNELAAMREREADAWDEGWKTGAHDQKRWSRWGEESDNYVGATPNPYRAAPASEGAADQR